jgi:class 3 adenylate cyclase
MRDVVARLGLEMRIGIHTGQIELTETGVVGLGVHIGQRVSSLASAGEILVSRTVVDLLAGSGLAFADHGEHQLKGVPGTWGVFALRPE